ncbi:putative membrane protein (plasmid) [Phaeobacter piscinae]|uniref:Membrane protein n=1 Tax=Phaeobacter piscinae TaxID=1580596 RepID=A0ABN5DKU6_9RHOB|nr:MULTISPECIES: bestrophin family ion channel [Phaeobacter]ATG38127.1 putative membrane protein [Phaeobacter piscinae]AUQ88648.1 putative membrane protein [Phaeobacter piscinae]AUQ92647.1 putative membrane protein [Phaeobacter inhibens]AUR26453.1 putative membrane protein [Phaeobacter piscinae]
MIVRDPPSSFQLFFVMQGSVVPKILGKIIGVALLSVIVLLIDRHVATLPHISIGAMGIFGVALSLFLGFRNNAAYDRWWEARKLWGSMIADIRNLGRHMCVFVGKGPDREHILSCAVAFAHLHRGFLRNTDVRADLIGWIGAEKADAMIARKNPADAALRSMADKIAKLIEQDAISGFGQLTVSQTLSSLALAQAGCERIVTTPLPFVYSLLVRRTTYLYCGLLPFALIESTGWFAPVFAAVVAYVFFGLQAVTNELELPFRNVQNGLPLDTMCRVIEISVCEALEKTPPASFTAANHVLT